MNTLKQVRIWHWQQFLHHRTVQYAGEANIRNIDAMVVTRRTVALRKDYVERVERHKGIAHMHLGAVQALNDVVPGSAEQDCAEATACAACGQQHKEL